MAIDGDSASDEDNIGGIEVSSDSEGENESEAVSALLPATVEQKREFVDLFKYR